MNPSHAATRRLFVKATSLVLVGCGGLAACATSDGTHEAEPAPPSIGSLTMLPAALPETLTVENRGARGGLGMLFGPLGSLAASHAIRKNGERLTEVLQATGVDLGSRLEEAVMQELSAAPIVPDRYADLQRIAKAREADDFKLLGIEADAVLDITVNSYGFYSSSGVDDYTPQVYVAMGLRSPKTSDWLGDASYAYDRSPSNGYHRHIQTAAEHKFSSVDALLSHSTRAIDALDSGMIKIAVAIASDVRTVLSGRFLE